MRNCGYTPPERLLQTARRIADEGLYGYIPAFEPGFGAGSYYLEEVPLPVNILPYCLTGFVYREATWEPSMTFDELKRRIHRRYFSPDALSQLVEDMIFLQQFSFDHWSEILTFARPRVNLLGEKMPKLTLAGERKRVQAIPDVKERKAAAALLQATVHKLAGVPGHLAHMARIEAAMDKLAVTATPKTRDGLAILRRMIEDTRTLYKKAVPDLKALATPIE